MRVVTEVAVKLSQIISLDLSGNNIGDEGLARLVPILGAAATDAATHRMNVIAIYEAVNPAKVGQVDQLLAKFDGLEKELLHTKRKEHNQKRLKIIQIFIRNESYYIFIWVCLVKEPNPKQ